MAALTRSGARKASEIVEFTLRTLHLSRLAMLSVVAVSSAISSSSQRRPRAIDATRVARFSGRIGRACCGDTPSGTKSPGAALILSSAKRPEGGVECHLLAIASLCFGKLDDQLLRLNLNSCDVSMDEASVVNFLRSFEVLATDLMTSASMSAAGTRRTDPARSAAPLKRAEDR